MASRTVLLLLLAVICTGFAAGEIPADCCLQVVNKHVPAKFIQSYFIQESGKGCSIPATVFTTKNGNALCVPHPDGHPWVQRVIKIIDQRN
ncbi:C-C motif chemokine 19-like [Sphaeramia orbicularis]|uniref:C-C motif chemokine 19-like n=1 Tax=Sphaeramia orbicularis TaxID=375764 RepID=A0A672Z6H8_9TELE|nr:C-C motif chemokine 19-like [Sphaeramia orbicularis]